MKITFLVNRDIASNLALNLLLPLLLKHQVTIFLSAKVGRPGKKPEALERLRFFEQNLFNEIVFPLAAQSPDSHPGRCRSFDEIGALIANPPQELNTINFEPGLAQLRQADPDLIVSIRYGAILKDAAIAVPRLGVINLHSGLLPDYRGVMASFWAMLNGEQQLGCSLHYINSSEIDQGDILAQSYLPVEPGRSYLWHVLQLYYGGSGLIEAAIEEFEHGRKPAATPQTGGGGYYTFPSAAELAEFTQAGFSLFDTAEMTDFVRQHFLSA